MKIARFVRFVARTEMRPPNTRQRWKTGALARHAVWFGCNLCVIAVLAATHTATMVLYPVRIYMTGWVYPRTDASVACCPTAHNARLPLAFVCSGGHPTPSEGVHAEGGKRWNGRWNLRQVVFNKVRW